MVRLLKVKELEDRRKYLVVRSEMYRQTLTLEVANVKFSAALLKRKFTSPKALLALLGLAAVPSAGLFFARRRAKAKATEAAGGFLPKLIVGWRLFQKLAPLVRKFRPARKAASGRRQNITQFP